VGNLTRDEVLGNITLTWFTTTGISSARLYHENAYGLFDAKGVSQVPVAVSVFPRELYQAPRSWTEQAYPNLIYYNKVDRGDHFAAWQELQEAACISSYASMTRSASERSRSPSTSPAPRHTHSPSGKALACRTRRGWRVSPPTSSAGPAFARDEYLGGDGPQPRFAKADSSQKPVV
jgi:hypothetical protein